eukprot:gene18461-24943_t
MSLAGGFQGDMYQVQTGGFQSDMFQAQTGEEQQRQE